MQGAAVEANPNNDPEADRNNDNLHPVMRLVQDRELGKLVMALSIPIAMGIVTALNDKLAKPEMSFILVLLCVGFAAIWNSILLRETWDKLAQILELLGMTLVLTSFFSIMAFFLPLGLSWIPAVCIALCLLPFVFVASQPPPR